LGWNVVFAHIYRALPLEPTADAIEAVADSKRVISVWASANALRYWAEKLETSSWEKVCLGSFVVTSNRIAEIAKDYFSGKIYVTDGPGNINISDCIFKLI
jgi:hypothetical protein